MRSRRLELAAALAFALVLVIVPGAFADSAGDRAEYKVAVEPICETNTKANERIFRGVRAEVQRGHLTAAAAQFTKAAGALDSTLKELRSVPRPPAYAPKLERWLSLVGKESTLFETIAADLRREDRAHAAATSTKLVAAANKANQQVLNFDFDYCWLEPARFL